MKCTATCCTTNSLNQYRYSTPPPLPRQHLNGSLHLPLPLPFPSQKRHFSNEQCFCVKGYTILQMSAAMREILTLKFFLLHTQHKVASLLHIRFVGMSHISPHQRLLNRAAISFKQSCLCCPKTSIMSANLIHFLPGAKVRYKAKCC